MLGTYDSYGEAVAARVEHAAKVRELGLATMYGVSRPEWNPDTRVFELYLRQYTKR